MGICMSATGIEVSDDDKRRHRDAEKSLKEVRVIHTGDPQCIYTCFLTEYLSTWELVGMCFQAKQKLAAQVKVRCRFPASRSPLNHVL